MQLLGLVATAAAALAALAASFHQHQRVGELERHIIHSAPSGVSFWHAETDRELVTKLPIVNPPRCNEFRVVYSIPLPKISRGDVVAAHTTFEITNPYTYVIMGGRFIVLGDSPSDVSGPRIGPAATRNILPGMRHDDKSQSASFVAAHDLDGKHVNVVAYTASMLAPDDEQYATLEQGYGSLFVHVVRGAQVAASVTPKRGRTDPNCVQS